MDDYEKDAGGDDYIEKVQRRAHAIWLDEGIAHGRDEEHWHQAEREIAAEEAAKTPKAVEPAEPPIKGAGAASQPAKGAGEPAVKRAGESPIRGAA